MKSKEYNNSDEILIVEDSPTQAEMLKFLLEKHNYRVSVACNGREALDLLNKHRPMMVISDIVMPEMDGYQLCRSIKDNENRKDIPVILLTALSDPADVLKGLECGADNFVIKPYDEKYLLSRIQYVLANRMLYESDKTQMGIEIFFGDQKYYITSARQQILNLLLSTYEIAVQKNLELHRAQDELKSLNDGLENKVAERTASYLAELEERKRAEEVLREAKEFSDSLITLMQDGFSVLDSHGVHINVNPALCQMTGFSREELIGTVPPHPYWPPEAYEEIDSAFQKTLRGEFGGFELTFMRKNGERFPAIVSPSWIKDKQGNVISYFATVKDITERKQAKEALEAALNNWQNTFNSISDSVFILDMEGRIVRSNGVFEHMIGINIEDVLGQYCYRAIHCMSDFIEDCPFKRMKQTGMRESFEFEDKERGLWFQVTMDPVYGESGEVINAVHIIRDVNELKKAEETRFENIQLVLANKAKSDFLSHMSHELRTPLNSIIGFSELLMIKTEGELNEKQEHYINNVLESSKHLLTLINDILDLSKVEAGKIELVIEKISVPETINDAVSLMKERAMKHNVSIKKDIDPQLEIEADRQRFKQILFNLLSNAVKFSKPEGGEVTITATKEDDMAKISVSDTGIGIREENMKKLFVEFEQLEKGISQKYGGTGLGLSITKHLVELHDGKLWAESKYGEGSTFTFMIPMTANKRGEIVSDER